MDATPPAPLAADHTPAAVRRRLQEPPPEGHLRDSVYGAVDGAITTFALVMGATGAELSSAVVLILGFANLLGDGFSMAVGNYLGTQSENEELEKARRSELVQIDLIPEGEREEVRQIFAAKGFEGEALEHVVDVITADRDRWVDTMVSEELGMHVHPRSPWRAGLATFLSFFVAGLVPLVPYVVAHIAGWEGPERWSIAMTAVTFVLIGTIKSRVVERPWWRSSLETLLLGGVASGLAFVVGMALRGLATG